jgi:hypothetical protein
LANPSELTRDLPRVENVDIAELHRRLLEEAKHRQAIESHARDPKQRGGIAANVQAAADKVAQVIERKDQKLATIKPPSIVKSDETEEMEKTNRVVTIVPTKGKALGCRAGVPDG